MSYNAGLTINNASFGVNYGGSFNANAGFTIRDKFFNPQNVIGTSSYDRGYKEVGASGGFGGGIGAQAGWMFGQGKTYLWDF